MFGDGVDSNANVALSAALRQQLQITSVFRGLMTVAFAHSVGLQLYLLRPATRIHVKLYF